MAEPKNTRRSFVVGALSKVAGAWLAVTAGGAVSTLLFGCPLAPKYGGPPPGSSELPRELQPQAPQPTMAKYGAPDVTAQEQPMVAKYGAPAPRPEDRPMAAKYGGPRPAPRDAGQPLHLMRPKYGARRD
ncbi:MAG: hypothetical protein ACYC8T_16165 [Myxococcaceae bacterium]